MKFIALLVISLAIITGGCVSSPPPSAPEPIVEPPAPEPVKPASSDSIELDAAIREASDYLNINVPRGSMIVILNIQSVSEALSDYVIDEFIANAVNDRVFTTVDRQQLVLIRAEHEFQMSGSVDDKNAVSIGKILGAQTIVSGRVRKMGDRYRMTIRALNVETAQVQGQYNRNNITGQTIAELMEKSGEGKEIKNSLAAVKAANEGDYIIRKSGERYVLTYDEIDIARGEFNFSDLSSVPAQAGAGETVIKNISESHTVKVYPDNQSAHLVKTPGSFARYMKYVEENYYPGRYIDYSGASRDFEPIRSPSFSIFRATVQIQSFSNGTIKVEQLLITHYNYNGRSYIKRYFSSDLGWIWGNITSSFRPIGESRQMEFDE
jgi:TolB-like protein